jgi:hypothetical protein
MNTLKKIFKKLLIKLKIWRKQTVKNEKKTGRFNNFIFSLKLYLLIIINYHYYCETGIFEI